MSEVIGHVAHAVSDVEPPPREVAVEFPTLDTLRAVGALAVLTTHAAFWAGDYTRHGALGTLLARLDVGVAIFFVLSGFLLSRTYLERAATGRQVPSTGRYLWKRFLRIAPVYVLTALLALVFIDANDGLGARDWMTTLLLANTFVDPTLPYGLTQMWSLSVEVSFYLALPVLMLVTLGRRPVLRSRRVLALLAVMAAVAVWWHLDGAARLGDRSNGATTQWLPGYLVWFAVGIGLALAQVLHTRGSHGRVLGWLVAAGRQPGSCWATAGGLMLVVATPLAGPTMLAAPTSGESLTKNLVYAAIGGLVVLPGIFTAPTGAYSRVFGHIGARRLGWISYSVFCLHLPILHLVMWATGWPLFQGRGLEIWLLTLVISLIAAELVYRLVERPAMRLKNIGRLRRTPTPETSSATRGTSTR